MYRIILLCIAIVLSWSIDIDLSIEKHLNKDDVVNRLVLVKYYLDKNITKAKKYDAEVLKIDKNNKTAKKYATEIRLKEELDKLIGDKSVDKYYQDLYFNNKYEEIKKLDKYLRVIKSDYPKLITARIYLWDGKYDKVGTILKKVKDTTNLNYVELRGYYCYYKGYYKCSKNNFSVLYNATGKLEYAYKLIDSLIYLGESDRAYKFVNSLLKRYPNYKQLLKYQQKLKATQENRLKQLEKIYKKTGKFEDLQKLVYLLFSQNKKKEAYKLLSEYVKKNPTDLNAKYWYATYLSWDGDNKKALKILQKIVTDNDYKTKLLMAKIYSWDGDYDKAINYTNDIIINAKDKDLVIDAKELEGLIYFWQQDYEMAKPILEEVLKYKNSQDAKEALMVINGDLKPLIAKYKKLYKKDITNLDYILRIAQYSEKIGDVDTAIEFYEKYYNLKPSNLNVAHTLAQLYLQKKDYYKAFSYYEYWAYSKGDVKSLYELAKNYYYAGYSKSALNVINDILKIKQYKPALELKAQILRYSPKFTQNNDSKTISDIFAEKNSKLLEVANRLYFNGFYYDASLYYKEYLLDNPNDAEIRERYAYALEFSNNFKQAGGEFFLLTWYKKDCNILYHYGYNLEKSDRKKLAKQVYKEALSYAIKPAPKFILDFINNWKKAWESQDINKYKQFYDKKYKNDKVWVIRKQSIFDSVKFISLYLADINLVKEEKKDGYNFYEVKFWQQYSTNKKVDKGYKTLVLKCKDKQCVIYKERWHKGKYVPVDYQCEKNINDRLKNIDKEPLNILQINTGNKKKNLNKDGLTKGGIVIVDNVDRPLAKEKDVLNIEELNITKKFSIKKGNVNYQAGDYGGGNKKWHKIGVLGYYYEDLHQIKDIDYGLFYETNKLYIDIKKWKLWQFDNERNGKYFTIHYKYNNKFTFGAEIGQYEGFSYIYPYLEYQSKWNYKYYQSITGKDMKSFCPVDKHLVTHHLIASKYKGINTNYKKELTDEWYSGEISKIDSDIALTPQFMYRFKKKHQIKNVEFYYYASGWYQVNTSPTTCFYSPSFYDSTFLEIHPVYKKLELIGKLGYSIYTDTLLYSYGFDFDVNWLNVGCMKNHSYKNGISGYWYEECYLKAGVEW
jgi:Flp pilus assembly protein TadD